jgi:phosphoserine phosphatase
MHGIIHRKFNLGFQLFAVLFALCLPWQVISAPLLPSWQDSPVKKRLIKFIIDTTKPNSPKFVEIKNRIAVFDNDGTLWVEKPVYFQMIYTYDALIKKLNENPKLATTMPYKVLIKQGLKGFSHLNKEQLLQVYSTINANMSVMTFKNRVKAWSLIHKHPKLHCKYSELTYLPMIELIKLLKSYGYTIYIVTGGGTEFVRVFSFKLYGIDDNYVIGSELKTNVIDNRGKLSFWRTNKIDYINDKTEKTLNIQRIIGKRPIIAVGNSDGDLSMLTYTSQNKINLPILIWHTDDKREYAYDKFSKVGHLDKALQSAKKNRWLIVNIKKDWKIVFKNRTCQHINK